MYRKDGGAHDEPLLNIDSGLRQVMLGARASR